MEMREGYKQTELGLIPFEWSVMPISSIAPLQRGFDLPHRAINPGSYPVVYSNGIEAFHSKFMVKGPGVVTGRSGTLGKVHYVDSDYWPHNTTLWVTRLGSNNAKFIYYLYSDLNFERFASGSGVPTLNRNDAHSFRVAIPSDPREQSAIATALSDVDALIAGLEKLIAKKRDLKQAAMQQLLTGQTRLPGFSGEWTVKRLGDLAEMGSGGTPSSANGAYYGGDIPWVAIADMTGGGKYIADTERKLTTLGLANSPAQMFPAGTVLYAMYASLGECSVATIPVTTSQAILGIRPKPDLHSEFLYYLLTSWKSMVKGLGQQGTQANLNKGMVADFKISLPAFDEQKSIAAVLVEMDTELVALDSRLSKTRELKQGMMQELLTGRTRLISKSEI
jgi:type I restriction enzyme S subunit